MVDTIEVYKIMLLGDGGVGKTSLLNKAVLDRFSNEYHMTVGVGMFIMKTKVDGIEAKMTIWDGGGQPRFREILKTYPKGAAGFIVMTDARLSSLNAVNEFVQLARLYNPLIPGILVEGKTDLPLNQYPQENGEIPQGYEHGELRRIVELNQLIPGPNDYAFPTSALTGEGIYRNEAENVLSFAGLDDLIRVMRIYRQAIIPRNNNQRADFNNTVDQEGLEL